MSLPYYIFQVLYVLCFTRPRYQVSFYRTIGPLVFSSDKNFCVLKNCIYLIYMTKKAHTAEIKVSMPMIRSKDKFKQEIL